MNGHRTAGLFVVAWSVVAVGCTGDVQPGFQLPPPAVPRLFVNVQFTTSGLQLNRIETDGDDSGFAAPGSAQLDYELLNPVGLVLASGQVADPRVARFEAFDGAAPEWLRASVGIGAATFVLPATAGTLIVNEPTTSGSHELGRVDYDPARPLPTPLLTMPDVLGTVKVVDHGPAAGHLNLAILAEGYTESELGTYRQVVANFVAELQVTPGFADHWAQINIWRIDVRSRQSGSGVNGIPKDTAFDTAYDTAGIHRLVAIETQSARDAAKALRDRVGADAALILVNSNDYGGSGDGGTLEGVIFAGYGADGKGVAPIAAHELGHAIWKLADEYEDAGLCNPTGAPTAPNIALSPVLGSLPWSRLVTPGVTLPTTSTDPTVVGAFAGAAYCLTRFRSQHDCRMRDLGHEFCKICHDQVDAYFAQLLITGAGGPTIGGAGNTASGNPQLAPGELFAIYGTKLATTTIQATSGVLPTSLGGAVVTVDGYGFSLPLYYASPTQINAQLPYELAPGPHALTVTVEGRAASRSISVTAAAPGVYVSQATGYAAATLGDNAVTDANRAKGGDTVVLYATGLGVKTPAQTTGQPARAGTSVSPVTVTIGGVSAQVDYAGVAPGFVGLDQINVMVPRGAPNGQLTVTAGGLSSTVTIPITSP